MNQAEEIILRSVKAELKQAREERDFEAQSVAMLQEALVQILDTEQMFNTDNAVKIANETLEAFAERKLKWVKINTVPV